VQKNIPAAYECQMSDFVVGINTSYDCIYP
jgi:hypothetical protein